MASFLLLEDGVSYLLLEDGVSKLILEDGPPLSTLTGAGTYALPYISRRLRIQFRPRHFTQIFPPPPPPIQYAVASRGRLWRRT